MSNEGIPGNNSVEFLNTRERERADDQSNEDLRVRLQKNSSPSDDERRLGAYKEMLEPQIRDAIMVLVKKGYITIDSGYDGRQYKTGKQYIGFEKGMIDSSLLLLVISAIDTNTVRASIEFAQRDFLELAPLRFVTLEEWKKIWDDVVKVFPDKGATAPFRDRFISQTGH